MSGIVIAGAGQAGFQAAASLRDNGYAGPVVLLGDEPELPYQRPPLSKAYLDGKADDEMLRLRPQSFFDEHRIEYHPGESLVRIRRAERQVELSSGRRLAYDHLVLATGSRNRVLPVPGADLDGVVQLRTRADAADLRRRLSGVRRAVVIGAGFIGLEFAAVAVQRGIPVSVIEATERPMSRALSVPMSSFFRAAHEAKGVRFLFDAPATRITGENGRATGVETAGAGHVEGDLVLVGIGVVPNVDAAVDAQLAVADGVLVDEQLVTSDPHISAIGDCASFPTPFADGRRVRIESVQNAADQARCVASRLAGRPASYAAVPWFWSDQGSLKLQIAGLSTPHEEAVLRGAPAGGAFSVFCFARGRLVGVESVNRPADHMAARRLLAGRIGITPEQAGDPGFDLKALASAPRSAGAAAA
ncbi:NAD(P)/FAD-dependent oxidoreductase [Enterovirga aerilata]|uniref:FAD-dependent oxidoreductase n=1 Tax=Enterovirga aerilata TaxID=2730920 RepID=A0A849I206_9HYPH|nr:FAD-dependent oxidoreductase [Enterovirga sp. DB1703]NNM71378.1 FAD-dependent oxidoreductase [Enterovirga sp. DB1703]